MIWSDIPGWFDWQETYFELAQSCTNESQIVEVGAWRGRSVCYLGATCQALEKRPSIWAVDTWAGSAEECQQNYIESVGGPQGLYSEFLTNVTACGLEGVVFPLRLPSVRGAERFDDQSLDFCFIDGAHDFNSVREDLCAWLPKIKPGGVIAGHDILMREVCDAVCSVLPDWSYRDRNVWWRVM